VGDDQERTTRLVLYVAAVAAAFAISPRPAEARYVDCGHGVVEGAGSYNIRAKWLPCSQARWVANRWSELTLAGDSARRVGRFSCSYRDAGYESVAVRCTRNHGRKAVRFLWGS
jgi:hypothetical protein